MAREAGLDLVEVAPQARPPVCRIMDYGKWKYAQKKKDQKAKVHRHESMLKEVRLRPKIDAHDLVIKVEQAREFLSKGDKVQFTMLFRGREMVHLDIGHQAFARIKEGLADVARVERDGKLEGRRMTMIVAPTAAPAPKKSPPKEERPERAAGPSAEQTPAPAPAPAAEPANPADQPVGAQGPQ